ncbi:MAG: nicotinate (nicotinamide) nucleotide adenylyltransferase [Limisphaerales bacterium]
MKRIGLFGGSFDPVHLGHLLVAQAAREEFGIDRVFFIPAARSPFKPDSVPAEDHHREQLLRLALSGKANFEIDLQELQRGGTSYTIDTVNAYRSRYPDAKLFWLIGADHVPTLDKWRDADELASKVEFLIIPRPGEADEQAPEPFVIHRLRGFPLGVSSSQIRDRVKAGLPVDQLVSPSVSEAIRNKGLYL